MQTAYQVQVATNEALLKSGKPDMWDSGKLKSYSNVAIKYDGRKLKSRTSYFWRVRIWDNNDAPTSFSPIAFFETAILDQNEWKAKWIITKSGSGNGYHSQFADSVDTVKWVQIDLGKPVQFSSVVLYPARPYDWKHDVPGFGFPVRYRIECCSEPDFKNPVIIADRTGSDQENPGTNPVTIRTGQHTARYIRIVATKLHHPEDTRPLFALAEMEVLDGGGRNLALCASVTAADSIEAYDWSTGKLTDGERISSRSSSISPLLRHEFSIDKPVKRARAYVTGLGYYELRLNGKKVGDMVLDPSWTVRDKRVSYSVYDVTSMIQQGNNCVGAMLGEGWWRNPLRFLVQMEIEFKDGSSKRVVSDESWKWSEGPIVENSLYHGETYDARREQRDWDKTGFDDSSWKPVSSAVPIDVKLSVQEMPPIKVVQTLAPKSVNSPKPGVYVFDFGQNFSGWCRLKVAGKVGTQVSLKHAELLFPDGTVNQQNLRSARATETYILKGVGSEVYEPRFTYHGFRYVQVEGYPGVPDLKSITGCVVHTALEQTGKFKCSNELINRIHECCVWGERTNFHSIPTDCPQRDERQGWMGDAHVSAKAMLYNFDMIAAYRNFLQNIKDAQGEDGSIPDTVPLVWGHQNGDPMWSAAYPLILWDVYKFTGDKDLLKEHYPGVKKYVDMLRREAKDFIIERNTYGDWIAVEDTPRDLISTASFMLVTDILLKMDFLLENRKSTDHAYLRECVEEAFNKRFYNPDTSQYGNGSQFSYAFPLYLDIDPSVGFPEIEADRTPILDNLISSVVDKHKGHLSTGFVGTPYLMDVLSRYGRADIAYTIITQKTYPGWGYMLENGATTIWELWKLETGPGMNSHNHPALGFVSGWFYENLAGIRIENDPSNLVIEPKVVGDLKWAEAEVNTVYGRVFSRWELTPKGLRLQVSIPANCLAQIYIPKAGAKSYEITENGVDTLSLAVDKGDYLFLRAGSGDYVYEMIKVE